MERSLDDSTIRVEHDREMPEVMTDAGPIQSWEVAITTPTFTYGTKIGLAGRSHDVDATLFAVIVERGLLAEYPGAKETDPFAQPDVREWIADNRGALEALVAALRA